MAVVTQEDARDDLKRKSKKRKKRDALEGEDDHIQIDDEGQRKKKKEILGDANASELVTDVDSNFGAHNRSRKEKDDIRIHRKKKKDEVTDSKRGEKKKKDKIRDEGGSSQADNVYEEIEHMEDRNIKKKKKAEDEVNDSRRGKMKKKNKSRDDGEASRVEGVSEEAEPVEDRKKEKKNKKAEDESRAGYNEKDLKVKKRKKKRKDDLGVGSLDEELVTNTNVPSVGNGESSENNSKKKKKIVGSDTEREGKAGALKTSERKNPIVSSERTTPGKKSKVIRFSDRVEFISLADNSRGTEKLKDHRKGKKKASRLRRHKVPSQTEDQIVENSEVNHEENNQTKRFDDGLIRGKRFSKEEDEIVKNSVLDYIERYQLGENGLEMVLKCGSYPELKGCWKEIGEALPSRPYTSVYSRAHILFERSESRQWTPEEIELIKEFHKKYGPDWRTLADELGKHRIHVKDTWRRIRYTDMKKGFWSQDEYESLFDLVNTDLRLKAFEERKSKHGMLRDNISWEAIGERLSSRGYALCCQKWYDQLTSPMVAEGIWADADDYRLIIALDELDASCLEDVDWDNLLEHRSGDVCRKRWSQMVRNIGEHGTKSFGEQVEILSKRYCPDVLEARVTYDSKTPIDL